MLGFYVTRTLLGGRNEFQQQDYLSGANHLTAARVLIALSFRQASMPSSVPCPRFPTRCLHFSSPFWSHFTPHSVFPSFRPHSLYTFVPRFFSAFWWHFTSIFLFHISPFPHISPFMVYCPFKSKNRRHNLTEKRAHLFTYHSFFSLSHTFQKKKNTPHYFSHAVKLPELARIEKTL